MQTQIGAPTIIQPAGQIPRPSTSGKTLPDSMQQRVGHAEDEDSEMDSEAEDEEDELLWTLAEDDKTVWQSIVDDLLEDAFAQTSTGAFACHSILHDLPNPGLAISNIGRFGLPLSERDAALIQMRVPPVMPRIVAVGSSQVILENPAFRTCMNTVRMQACSALGVDPASCVMLFHNLLLCAEGSFISPRLSTRMMANHFATVNVILPSAYSGGNYIAQHDGKVHLSEGQQYSAFGASFECAFVDTFYSKEPVIAGNCLALCYTLNWTSDIKPIPRAPVTSTKMLDLKAHLQSWIKRRESGLQAPQMLVHILSHYTCATVPTFQDPPSESWAKLKYLVDVANELGLCLAIGKLSVQVSGDVLSRREGTPECGRWRCHGDCYSCLEAEEDNEMDDDGEIKTTYKLEGMTRPDGEVIDLTRLDLDPACLTPEFDYGQEDHDQKESAYDKVTMSYFRSVLTIWPKCEDFNIMLTTVPDSAINTFVENEIARLSALTNAPATGVLNSQLISRIQQSDHTLRRLGCALAILEAAIVSRNLDLFSKVITLTRCYTLIQADTWAKALRVFEFAQLRTFLDQAITVQRDGFSTHNHPNALARINLIYYSITTIIDKLEEDCSEDLHQWANEQMISVLASEDLSDRIMSFVLRFIRGLEFEASRQILDPHFAKVIVQSSSSYRADQQLEATYNIAQEVAGFYSYDQEAQRYFKTKAQQLLANRELSAKTIPCVLACVRDQPFEACSSFLTDVYNNIKKKVQGYMPNAQSPQVSLATALTKRLLQLPSFDLESARFCKDKLVELWPKHNSFIDTTTMVDLVGLVGIAVVATQILDTPEGFSNSQGARVDLLEQLVIFSQNDPQVLDYVRKDLNRLSKSYEWHPNTHSGWKDLRDHSGTRALKVSGNIDTITKFVDLCLRLQRSGIILALFSGLKPSTPADLTCICNPLLEALQPIFRAHNLSFRQAPALNIAQDTLSWSIKTFLGPLPTAPLDLSISGKILNPGQWDVNAFLADPARHCMRISALSATRARTESALNKFVRGGLLLPMETTKQRSPYTLVIRKKIQGVRRITLATAPSSDQIKAWTLAIYECNKPNCTQCASLSLLIERADGREKVNETVKAIGGSAVAMEILRDDPATLQLMNGVIDGIAFRTGAPRAAPQPSNGALSAQMKQELVQALLLCSQDQIKQVASMVRSARPDLYHQDNDATCIMRINTLDDNTLSKLYRSIPRPLRQKDSNVA